MTDRREASRLCIRVLICALLAATPAAAQTDRYLSRAVGDVFQGTQITESECHAAGTMGDEVSCDRSTRCCFDQPNGCSGSTPTGSRCRGGTGATEVAATEGFPRVSSRVGSVSAGLSGSAFGISGVFAIADSDGIAIDSDPSLGGLTASCGIVTVTSGEVTEIPITQTDIDIPITSGVVARCTRNRTIEDGLSVIEVTVVLLEATPGGAEIMQANALAGLELPFTTGGAACAVAGAGSGPDWQVFGWLIALAAIVLRRRKH